MRIIISEALGHRSLRIVDGVAEGRLALLVFETGQFLVLLHEYLEHAHGRPDESVARHEDQKHDHQRRLPQIGQVKDALFGGATDEE